MKIEELNHENHYTVSGYGGIAFYFYGPEVEKRFTEYEEYEEIETGNALMIMVGDNRKHSVDPDDITILPEEDYCASCGQIGCRADGRERQ